MAAIAPGGRGTWLAPLPYFLAGLIPLGIGTLLSGVSGFPMRPQVWGTSVLAAAALILAAFASREAFAPEGRCPSLPGPSPSGARRLAYGALTLAALLGLLMQWRWQTGDLTIPLGGLGILTGYFYFAPPLAWHRRGLGEVAGALSFGLLPVVAGFYLQGGHLVTEVLLYGLPLSFAGFNLFLIHGFPPPAGEAPPARHSLAARMGPVAGALLYTLLNILTIVGLVFCLVFPASPLPFREGLLPLLLLAVVNQELVKRQAYREEARLRLLCRLTLALHLGMGLGFTLMLWRRL
jgi:1,4-dihydroxy-2-naphthoate octaprenyltransferase